MSIAQQAQIGESGMTPEADRTDALSKTLGEEAAKQDAAEDAIRSNTP